MTDIDHAKAQRQLVAPPAPNPMGKDLMRIVERYYAPSPVPGRPPVLTKMVARPLVVF